MPFLECSDSCAYGSCEQFSGTCSEVDCNPSK